MPAKDNGHAHVWTTRHNGHAKREGKNPRYYQTCSCGAHKKVGR